MNSDDTPQEYSNYFAFFAVIFMIFLLFVCDSNSLDWYDDRTQRVRTFIGQKAIRQFVTGAACMKPQLVHHIQCDSIWKSFCWNVSCLFVHLESFRCIRMRRQPIAIHCDFIWNVLIFISSVNHNHCQKLKSLIRWSVELHFMMMKSITSRTKA